MSPPRPVCLTHPSATPQHRAYSHDYCACVCQRGKIKHSHSCTDEQKPIIQKKKKKPKCGGKAFEAEVESLFEKETEHRKKKTTCDLQLATELFKHATC